MSEKHVKKINSEITDNRSCSSKAHPPPCSEAERPTTSNHADAHQDKDRKIESNRPEKPKLNLKADTRGVGGAE